MHVCTRSDKNCTQKKVVLALFQLSELKLVLIELQSTQKLPQCRQPSHQQERTSHGRIDAFHGCCFSWLLPYVNDTHSTCQRSILISGSKSANAFASTFRRCNVTSLSCVMRSHTCCLCHSQCCTAGLINGYTPMSHVLQST